MDMTAPTSPYDGKQLDSSQRKQLALEAINDSHSITALADQHNVSRKFVYQQKNKAVHAVTEAFEPPTQEKTEKVLFYLPVTFSWRCQFILSLLLHCRAHYRGMQKLLRDAFDRDIDFCQMGIAAMVAKTTGDLIEKAMEAVKIKTVLDWVKKILNNRCKQKGMKYFLGATIVTKTEPLTRLL